MQRRAVSLTAERARKRRVRREKIVHPSTIHTKSNPADYAEQIGQQPPEAHEHDGPGDDEA